MAGTQRAHRGHGCVLAVLWPAGAAGALLLDRWLLTAAWDEVAATSRGAARFGELVDALALLTTAVAVTWLSAAVTACVVAETSRLGRRLAGPAAVALAPRGLRVAVRIACGVAVAGPLAAPPATAAEPPPAACGTSACGAPIAGLPLPDRPDVVADHETANGGFAAARTQQSIPEPPARRQTAVRVSLPATPAHQLVTVQAGDSLWSIAAAHLPPGADPGDPADIAAAWPRWHHANRAVIGPDPDLIHPGMQLAVPEHPATPSTASPDR